MMTLITGGVALYGQRGISIQPGERVILFSDRTLYIAGENILFSAFLQSLDGLDKYELSRVLYCELITPDGNKINGNKYLIENAFTCGYLSIPGDIITGNYYLRAYTKFMRNAGPSSYHYTLIKIVNPFRSEVQSATDNNYLSEPLSYKESPENVTDSFIISTDKSKYAPRDKVHLSIEGIERNKSFWKGLSLAVVPEFSKSATLVTLPGNGQFEARAFYYPETRGLSITGNLTDNKTGKPLSHSCVNLSIIGRGKDFMAVQTDTTGRFFFSLPDYTGSRDLFLSAENTISTDPKILVDNDFCTISVHLASNVFTLTRQERETAFNMAVNVQLESYFKVDSISGKPIDKYEDKAFYGKPSEIIYIDNYVSLPTLEEYFNALITLVKVRKQQGKNYFKVFGIQPELNDFDPLVLVDLVAIGDPARVLAIPPTNISRIEVVNMLYVKGDQIYGGIINIITKQGDFAGIDLPSSGIFINYGFLADNSPSHGIYPPLLHSPDTRNTLYWAPKLILDKSNAAKISFTTSDTPGRYLIIMNGINLKGEEFIQTSSFEVLK